LSIHLLFFAAGDLLAEHAACAKVLAGCLCEEGFGLGPMVKCVGMFRFDRNLLGKSGNLLSNLLAPILAQLGCAWAHDGIGRRDVRLLASAIEYSLANYFYKSPKSVAR
jgi:hypothetical protein